MREILFRGKRVSNGKWIEGYIFTQHNSTERRDDYYIRTYDTDYLVIPETVGQYTGLTDKNGKKIFEGDIIDCWSEGINAQGAVRQRIDGLWIIYPAWQNQQFWGLCPNRNGSTSVKIIGNIHDNRELLKGGAES